jgi:hypothetical protein
MTNAVHPNYIGAVPAHQPAFETYDIDTLHVVFSDDNLAVGAYSRTSLSVLELTLPQGPARLMRMPASSGIRPTSRACVALLHLHSATR